MGTIANAKVTHYYNCYNGDFIGCLLICWVGLIISAIFQNSFRKGHLEYHRYNCRCSFNRSSY